MEIDIQNGAFKTNFRDRRCLGYYSYSHDQRKHIDKYLIYKIYRLTINNVTCMILLNLSAEVKPD